MYAVTEPLRAEHIWGNKYLYICTFSSLCESRYIEYLLLDNNESFSLQNQYHGMADEALASYQSFYWPTLQEE